MSKLNVTTILAAAALVLALLGYWTASGIAPYIIIIGLGAGVLSTLNIYHIGSYSKQNHNYTMIMTVGTIVVLFTGFTLGGLTAIKTPSLSVPGVNEQPTSLPQDGQTVTAKFNFYPSGAIGGAYGGAGLVYLLDPTVAPDRYSFMKILADGQTGKLTYNGVQASSISVSSGAFTKNQLSGTVGKTIEMCGYLDTSPAAAENVSFCRPITLTGVTGGSTPEWMYTGGDFIWRNYPTTQFYDSSDTHRTIYTEKQTVAIEKHVKAYVFPTNNGEEIVDAALYLESPASSAGAIEDITITGPTGKSVVYTSLQSTGQMSSNDPRFTAAPTLTTSTDTMYFVGAFPEDAVRTSTSDKAVYTVDVRYNHPASSYVLMYLKGTVNSNAKTVSGGHFDFGDKLTINMTDDSNASTGWT